MMVDEMKEDSYGGKKRLQFLKNIIEQHQPKTVLDIGCGIGTTVVSPLAECFPHIRFVGADTDKVTVEYALDHNIFPNLTFVELKDFDANNKFDLIIASEVIEHVPNPDQFLLFLKEKLTDNGKIFLTLPNGWGPFEWTALAEVLVHLSGVYKIFKSITTRRGNQAMPKMYNIKNLNTLAITPHLHFFSYKEVVDLIKNTGFIIREYRARTFLCGAGFNQLLHGVHLILLNAKISDYLPPCFSSDWMFLVESGEGLQTNNSLFRQGNYARFRRYLNEKYVEYLLRNQRE